MDNYENYNYFLEKDFSEYAGKWLAIIDKKVVASSLNVEELITRVKKQYPSKRPFITKIRTKLSILKS